MIKKVFLYGCLLVVLAATGLWLLGLGLWAEPWKSAEVVSGPRVEVAAAHSGPSILFGDLHVHTSFSQDAALFGLPLVTDSDIALPSDACDFARYCSALDFWSINDHAEGMTPRSWQDSVQAIRDCNAQSGDPANPDLVSLLGWEWSHNSSEAATHYGHKNVIFREWEQGRSPLRPIASSKRHLRCRVFSRRYCADDSRKRRVQHTYGRRVSSLGQLFQVNENNSYSWASTGQGRPPAPWLWPVRQGTEGG